MKRYCALYLKYFTVNFRSLLIYRHELFFGILSLLFKNFVNLIILLIIFDIVDSLNFWDFSHVLLFYGMSYFSYAFWHCFFINTITIPTYVNSGQLDLMLTKPISPLFQIFASGFDEDGWGDLLFGVGIILVALSNLHLPFYYVLLAVPLCAFGSLVYAGISLLLSIISFFTVGNSDYTDLTMELQEFAKYPLDIFSKSLRVIFSTVLPIGFASFFPSLVLLQIGNNTLQTVLYYLGCLGFSLLFFTICCIIWNLALKYYKSSGT